ncbi:MAG TPA: efflux RND transporter periplasmic adaptor subunit [Woeseiaceae bacterium]
MRYRISICLVLVAGLVSACSEEPAGTARGGWGAAPKIASAPIERRRMVDEIEALGTAFANESVEIQPRVSSLIERVAFNEGDDVKAGQLLVELEHSEIAAGLAVAEANLTESRSLYERSKSLASSQAISASNLEQLLAQVQVDEAEVEAARARLALTAIRAPFAGRVGLRRISPGSFVTNATVITTLDDVSRIKLDFSVPETFLTAVEEGMRIEARSIVYPGRTFDGVVASIDTRLDPVSRAVQVRAILPNDDDVLRPGMFMTVGLKRDLGEVLMAPEQSIVPEGTVQYVFVVKDGVVEKRTITIGRRIPGYVVVLDGVDEGERVVAEGTGKVRDGIQVEDIANADL